MTIFIAKPRNSPMCWILLCASTGIQEQLSNYYTSVMGENSLDFEELDRGNDWCLNHSEEVQQYCLDIVSNFCSLEVVLEFAKIFEVEVVYAKNYQPD